MDRMSGSIGNKRKGRSEKGCFGLQSSGYTGQERWGKNSGKRIRNGTVSVRKGRQGNGALFPKQIKASLIKKFLFYKFFFHLVISLL